MTAPSLVPAQSSRFWAIPRAVLLLSSSRAVTDTAPVRDGLVRWRDEWMGSVSGFDPLVRIGLAMPGGSRLLEEALVGRDVEMEPMDAVIELSLRRYKPSDGDLEDLVELVQGAFDGLEDVFERDRVTVLSGLAHLVSPGDGPTLVAFAFRHDPSITLAEANAWFAQIHGEMTVQHANPFPLGYHQLHVDPALTGRVAEAAALPEPDFDMFDSIYYPDAADFADGVRGASPEDAQRAIDDEAGHIVYGTWRGAVCEVV